MPERRAGDPILIKRYAKSRLYDTVSGAYLSLDDLAGMVLARRRFTVRDADTSEDITMEILRRLR